MFHICYGYIIPYKDWNDLRKLNSPSQFLTQLGLHLYGPRQFVLRAVDLKTAENRKDIDSPRKPITPKKAGIFRSKSIKLIRNVFKFLFDFLFFIFLECFIDFLLRKNEISERSLKQLQAALSSNDVLSSRLKSLKKK